MSGLGNHALGARKRGVDKMLNWAALGGKSNKRPRPSYEEGKLRDPSIEKMQDKAYQLRDLTRLLQKSVKRRQR